MCIRDRPIKLSVSKLNDNTSFGRKWQWRIILQLRERLGCFNLIFSLPRHIQVCTCCCLSTQQQPQQLFLFAQNYATLHKTIYPPESLFDAAAIVSLHLHIQRLTAYTFHSTGEIRPIIIWPVRPRARFQCKSIEKIPVWGPYVMARAGPEKAVRTC